MEALLCAVGPPRRGSGGGRRRAEEGGGGRRAESTHQAGPGRSDHDIAAAQHEGVAFLCKTPPRRGSARCDWQPQQKGVGCTEGGVVPAEDVTLANGPADQMPHGSVGMLEPEPELR